MINIRLTIRGKDKEFVARGINIRASYTAYELFREYTMADGDYSPDLLQRCAEFVCLCFGHAFSAEQLETGYQGSAFRLYPALLNAVITYSNEQIVNFPEAATATAPAAAES